MNAPFWFYAGALIFSVWFFERQRAREFKRAYLLALNHVDRELRRQGKNNPLVIPKTPREIIAQLAEEEMRNG